jgi:hypothetical protein
MTSNGRVDGQRRNRKNAPFSTMDACSEDGRYMDRDIDGIPRDHDDQP